MKVAPSILACDFSNMASELSKINNADMVHIDVMDGHFVPNITFGPDVVKSLRKHSSLVFDVHLMVSEPYKYIDRFSECGADIITFHIESDSNIMDTINKIRSNNKKVGLAIKPNTHISDIYNYLKYIDMVLVMTVEPGFGGQSFINNQVEKIKKIKEKINEYNLNNIEIEVDGGINLETAKISHNYGADICVAGTSLFHSKNLQNELLSLKSI